MNKKNLLISEPPLQVLPSLAVAIGLNEAIVIQQLHYWTQNQQTKGEVDPAGNKWIFNTYEEWKEGNFPFWSEATIQRIFLNLEKMGLVVSAQLNSAKRDMRKYYRLDYDALNNLDDIKLGPSHDSKLTSSHDSNLGRSNASHWDDVNSKSETTTETTQREKEISLNFRDMTIPQARKVPTLKMYADATGWFPADVLWEEVHTTITKHSLTVERIASAAKAWVGRGYKRGNVTGILEWAINGVPGEKSNSPAPVEVDPFASLKEMLARQEAKQ